MLLPSQGLSALVVDDVASNRRLTAMMLEKMGFVTDVAEDGQVGARAAPRTACAADGVCRARARTRGRRSLASFDLSPTKRHRPPPPRAAPMGQVAVERVTAAARSVRPYAVIFMDRTMPNMDGIQACDGV